MALDHGILNLPLGHSARGGSIDAQIDRYKVQKAKEDAAARRAVFRSVREKKAQITALLAELSDARVLELAAPLGKRKPSTARAALVSAASSNLDRWLAALERELAASIPKFEPAGAE